MTRTRGCKREMAPYVLAIDAGTSGVRAIIFDEESRQLGAAYEEIVSAFPQPGWIEQDPLQIWDATRRVVGETLRRADLTPSALAGIGIANQRATTVVWERRTSRPVYPAISWQDVRTAERVETLLSEGIFANSMASATKLEWVLQNRDDGFAQAEAGGLCFGTVDTWLVWQLSGGRVHATDHSNASCTGLYDFVNGAWDEQVLNHLRLPGVLLPAIRQSSEHYATTDREVFGAAVPLSGIAGDQQAAMFGELGFERGAVKVTVGTSAMLDVNVGEFPALSHRGAYPLILWELNGQRSYCLEGTVITAGAAIQWLRDGRSSRTRPRPAPWRHRWRTAAACGRCPRCRAWERRTWMPAAAQSSADFLAAAPERTWCGRCSKASPSGAAKCWRPY